MNNNELTNIKNESMTLCLNCMIRWDGYINKCEKCGATDKGDYPRLEHYCHFEDVIELVEEKGDE